MTGTRTIEIDFDVHRLIEIERRGFDETPNDVLRRLLGCEPNNEPVKITGNKQLATTRQRPWSTDGVTLPHGTSIRMSYNGHIYSGSIQDGFWVVGGEKFTSPSGAAGGVAITKKGTKTKLDGWIYWQVKRPGDTDWTVVQDLRPKPVFNGTVEELLGE